MHGKYQILAVSLLENITKHYIRPHWQGQKAGWASPEVRRHYIDITCLQPQVLFSCHNGNPQ
jgi:hypothetical protein